MKFTLDTTAIISVEKEKKHNKEKEDAKYVKKLVDLNCKKGIKVYYCVASAAERRPKSREPKEFMEESYEIYEKRLKSINFEHLNKILLPICDWDQCYWDQGLWGEEKSKISELRELTAITIFKKSWEKLLPTSWKDWSKRRDVEVFISHVYNGGGILVTSDKNHFHKKKQELKRIAKEEYNYDIEILYPKEAQQKAINHI